MKVSRSTRTALVALVTAMALTGFQGCRPKSKPQPVPGLGNVPGMGQGSDIGMGSTRPLGELDMANQQRGMFAPVLFAFDSAKISSTEAAKLPAVAQYIKVNSSKTLVIEGHCDERGTAEYNRALGERRAQAAREELVQLGVPASRITTVSFGKDKPADPGHDEAAWAKNRRCEFVIAGQ
jgi:peptidoglycan-associated lipoprotein